MHDTYAFFWAACIALSASVSASYGRNTAYAVIHFIHGMHYEGKAVGGLPDGRLLPFSGFLNGEFPPSKCPNSLRCKLFDRFPRISTWEIWEVKEMPGLSWASMVGAMLVQPSFQRANGRVATAYLCNTCTRDLFRGSAVETEDFFKDGKAIGSDLPRVSKQSPVGVRRGDAGF